VEDTITQLIRDTAARMPSEATAYDIAVTVVEDLSTEFLEEYLPTLMAMKVRIVLNHERGAALDRVSRPPGISVKLERRRSWWARTLDTRVALGDSNWKKLGECTKDDLYLCIAEREEHIRGVADQIGNYRLLIKLMEKHSAATVSDLTMEQVTDQ
jgi:hypothetical protein